MAAAPTTPFAPGAGAASVQSVVTNLQNMVQAINALTASLSSNFGVNHVYTVSTLPVVAAPARAFVTDSTVAASTHFGSAVVGGGMNTVPVYWDNTSWKIG